MDKIQKDLESALTNLIYKVIPLKNLKHNKIIEEFSKTVRFLPCQVKTIDNNITYTLPKFTDTKTPIDIKGVIKRKKLGLYRGITNKMSPQEFKNLVNSKQDDFILSTLITHYKSIHSFLVEHQFDSINISKSASVFSSSNILNSSRIFNSKYIFYSDNIYNSKYLFASSGVSNSVYSIKVSESFNIAYSLNVSYSRDIVKSFMIHDCANITEGILCSHITNKKYCIANTELPIEVYERLKPKLLNLLFKPYINQLQ